MLPRSSEGSALTFWKGSAMIKSKLEPIPEDPHSYSRSVSIRSSISTAFKTASGCSLCRRGGAVSFSSVPSTVSYPGATSKLPEFLSHIPRRFSSSQYGPPLLRRQADVPTTSSLCPFSISRIRRYCPSFWLP